MQNNEETNDIDVEEENIDEEVELEEEVEESEEESEPTEDKSEDELAELKKQNAILKRQNKKLKKTSKKTSKESKVETDDSNTLTREEAILFAKGLEEEDVDDIKFIADRKGINLIEASKTREFKTLQKTREVDKKNENAQLRASKGSKVTRKKSFQTENLSAEDHKRLFEEKMGL